MASAQDGMLGVQELQLEESPESYSILTPTIGGTYAIGTQPLDRRYKNDVGLNLWTGLRFHPGLADKNSYFALGAEWEWHKTLDGRDAMYIMPMARVGWTWNTCGENAGYLSTTFSCLKLYTIAGFRPRSLSRHANVRFGIGATTTYWLRNAILLLPGTVELVWDVNMVNEPVFTFRVGHGF